MARQLFLLVSSLITLGGTLATLGACQPALVRPAPFRARPDSITFGNLRGPFEGRVMDGETDRPVAGALVYATWSFVVGSGTPAPDGWREWLGSTDALGYYKIPQLEDLPGPPVRLSDFRLVVYKRGYVAYRSDRRFEDFGPRTDFTQLGVTLTLAKWRPDLSHVRHLRYVGGGAALRELISWQVPEALAELGGGPARPRQPAVEPSQPTGQKLSADRLLTPDDVKKVTRFEGIFDVSDLGDEPTTAEYDSVHMQARGKGEGFDVALRLWRVTPAEAQKHFDRLAGELPGAQLKNELADRSLRAATPNGDIFGISFLDRRRGVVVLLQCGASQCRSHNEALALARTIHSRVEAEFSVQGVGP